MPVRASRSAGAFFVEASGSESPPMSASAGGGVVEVGSPQAAAYSLPDPVGYLGGGGGGNDQFGGIGGSNNDQFGGGGGDPFGGGGDQFGGLPQQQQQQQVTGRREGRWSVSRE